MNDNVEIAVSMMQYTRSGKQGAFCKLNGHDSNDYNLL